MWTNIEKKKDCRGLPTIAFRSDRTENVRYIEGVRHCYTYFPSQFDAKDFGFSRDDVYKKLKRANIFARRYFYPLISQFPTYRGLQSAKSENLTVSSKITEQVLCLPIYPNLKKVDVAKICEVIISSNI